jgi:hypothetical protein
MAYDADASALNGSCLMFEVIAVSQQCPCHPRVLGSDRYRRAFIEECVQ